MYFRIDITGICFIITLNCNAPPPPPNTLEPSRQRSLVVIVYACRTWPTANQAKSEMDQLLPLAQPSSANQAGSVLWNLKKGARNSKKKKACGLPFSFPFACQKRTHRRKKKRTMCSESCAVGFFLFLLHFGTGRDCI